MSVAHIFDGGFWVQIESTVLEVGLKFCQIVRIGNGLQRIVAAYRRRHVGGLILIRNDFLWIEFSFWLFDWIYVVKFFEILIILSNITCLYWVTFEDFFESHVELIILTSYITVACVIMLNLRSIISKNVISKKKHKCMICDFTGTRKGYSNLVCTKKIRFWIIISNTQLTILLIYWWIRNFLT